MRELGRAIFCQAYYQLCCTLGHHNDQERKWEWWYKVQPDLSLKTTYSWGSSRWKSLFPRSKPVVKSRKTKHLGPCLINRFVPPLKKVNVRV